MKKPEKTPFLEYYLGPVLALAAATGDAVLFLYRRLAGRWFCEYCKTYHSRRTIKKRRYLVWREADIVCSRAFENTESTQ